MMPSSPPISLAGTRTGVSTSTWPTFARLARLARLAGRPPTAAPTAPPDRNVPFPPADLACWYTDRGFHFYVADLRAPRAPRAPRGPAPDGRPDGPAEYFACLDAAVRHARDADGIETVVPSGHGSGALIAALGRDAGGAEL